VQRSRWGFLRNSWGRLRRSLDCPTTCAKAGWSCQDNICKAQPPYCVLVTCARLRRSLLWHDREWVR